MKSKHVFLTMLLSLTFIIGCDKDDDKPDPADNYFQFGEIESDLLGGLSFGAYNSNEDLYSYSLQLYSSGLSVVDYGSLHTISGIGNVIGMNIYTTAVNGYTPGIYNNSSTGEAGTFHFASCQIGYDTDNASWESFTSFNDGTISIELSGSMYEINFNLIAADGTVLNGTYYGEIFFDEYYMP